LQAFDEDSTAAVVPTKSILSTGTGNRGVIQKERSVVFDPTVLFLDVAYEGEYELLVELAAKIADISVANGEGITALHNGICAGNHDIVKFLIDHHANVNALVRTPYSSMHYCLVLSR
jgi:ankyrin repeat protein